MFLLAPFPCLLGHNIVPLGCIRKYGKSSKTDPPTWSQNSALSPGSLLAKQAQNKVWDATSNRRKVNQFPNWDGKVLITFQWMYIWIYMNTLTAISYLFFFCIPMESIGFRNAWCKQKHRLLHLVPLRHLAGRWDLSWHPPSSFGASPSPSQAFHSSPHQVLILLSFFNYFPLGVCDHGLKRSDSHRHSYRGFRILIWGLET